MNIMKIKFVSKRRIRLIFTCFFVFLGIISGFVARSAINAHTVYLNDEAVEGGIKLSVIMYHSITNNSKKISNYAVSTKMFEDDIKYLSDNGFSFINTDDLKNYVYYNSALPQKPVMITFDDGFYDNFTNAVPILEKYNAKAVISPIGKTIDDYTQNGDKNEEYAYLDRETITQLSKSNVIVFENHSYNMHSNKGRNGCAKKRGEPLDEYAKILEADLKKAHDIIYECTKRHPVAMVYPFGSTSNEAYGVIKKLGYVMSFSCTEGINVITKNPKSLFMLKRFNRTPYKNSKSFFADKLY